MMLLNGMKGKDRDWAASFSMKSHQPVDVAIRRGFTHRFSYSIYFDLEAKIYVFAVLHPKRHPDEWQDRGRSR